MNKLLLAVVLLCGTSQAYEVYTNWLGEPISWSSSHITYSISKLPKRQRAVIKQAFALWSLVIRKEFEEVSEGADIEVVVERNRVLPFDILGLSTVDFAGHDITHGKIQLNWQNKLSRTYLFILSLHEIGHCIGLAHSPDPAALMYYSPTHASWFGSDDLSGAYYLYPGTAP